MIFETMQVSQGMPLFLSYTGPIIMYVLLLYVVLRIAIILAEPEMRKEVIWGGIAAWAVACLKIWLVQQTPQWHDIPLDSITYKLQAQAFALHWVGVPVDAFQFRLSGLLAWYNGTPDIYWKPSETLSYTSVLGSYEWLYPVFVACWNILSEDWLQWAIYSNAALAAFFPVAAFGIARSLGASYKVAGAAFLITLVDPSAAVNASWILKDTLACFLAMAALWAGLNLLDNPQWNAVSIFGLSISLLGSVRYVGSNVIIIATLVVMFFSIKKRSRRIAVSIGVSVAIIPIMMGILYTYPQVLQLNKLYQSISNPLYGAYDTLITSAATPKVSAADPTVSSWIQRLRKEPVKSVCISIAHTLFAPYPWAFLKDNFDPNNAMLLYMIGSIWWIICLPAVFLGLMHRLRMPPYMHILFITIILGALLGVYTLYLGEWSTRQRVFMLPVFFVFVAFGLFNSNIVIHPRLVLKRWFVREK